MTDWKTCFVFVQLPYGPGVSDLQCPVHYRAICRLRHRNPLLDGEYFDCADTPNIKLFMIPSGKLIENTSVFRHWGM